MFLGSPIISYQLAANMDSVRYTGTLTYKIGVLQELVRPGSTRSTMAIRKVFTTYTDKQGPCCILTF